ncbi:MAG: hypothetical protein ACE5HJ_06480 [Thermoplasmata archaeon]
MRHLVGSFYGGRGIRSTLKPDVRKFNDREDRIGYCRKCGARLILLPDDKRQGYCFDCIDLLEVGG